MSKNVRTIFAVFKVLKCTEFRPTWHDLILCNSCARVPNSPIFPIIPIFPIFPIFPPIFWKIGPIFPILFKQCPIFYIMFEIRGVSTKIRDVMVTKVLSAENLTPPFMKMMHFSTQVLKWFRHFSGLYHPFLRKKDFNFSGNQRECPR